MKIIKRSKPNQTHSKQSRKKDKKGNVYIFNNVESFLYSSCNAKRENMGTTLNIHKLMPSRQTA